MVPAMTRSSLRTVEWMILTADLATTTAYVDELDDPVENCENVFLAVREVT